MLLNEVASVYKTVNNCSYQLKLLNSESKCVYTLNKKRLTETPKHSIFQKQF